MELNQSVAFNYPVLMVSSSDHVTGKEGLAASLAITLSKAGSAYVIILPTVVERGDGNYVLVLTAAMVDTIGAFALHIEAPGADPYDSFDQVIAVPPSLIPSSGSIATLSMLKAILGIDEEDVSQDVYLAQLLLNAAVDFEGMTKRRFRTPELRTEYRDGDGNRILYLRGHIDDVNAVDSGSDDPAQSLIVSRRARVFGSPSWEALVVDEDFERRKDTLLFTRAWYVWPCEDEFKITYLDGYTIAPDDVREAIIDMAMNRYLSNLASSSGTAGVTSESLGDFSYSVDLGATTSAGGNGALSDTTKGTIQRYKRKFV